MQTPDIFVTKRDGRKEKFDESKILRAVYWACDGLNVNPKNILDKTFLLLRSEISTAEVQKSLTIAAADLIGINCMDASFAAARLSLLDLYKTVRMNLNISDDDSFNMQYPHIRTYLEHAVKCSNVSEELLDSSFDLDKINEVIDNKCDLNFQYLGLTTLISRYLIREHETRKVIELPQHFLMRVSMGIALAEKPELRTEKAIEFYKLYKDLDYLSSTPTLFNSGTTHSQLSSCYVNHMSDSLSDDEEDTQDNRYKSIIGTIDESARFSKYAGGIGTNVTAVRCQGSHIKSTNGISSGVIPYIKVLNNTLLAVNQGGKRPGSAAVYLEPWHGDYLQFAELRKNTGDDRLRAHDIFPASWIPSLFIQRVKEKGDWSLFNPKDHPELYNTWGEEFEEIYTRLEKEGKAIKTLKAMDVWKVMLSNIFSTGFPWFTFKDNFNKRNPQAHVGMIRSSNLCCVAGDQLVTTDRGVFTAKELYEKGGENVVPGLSWYNRASAMLLPRPNAPMRLLKTKEGYTHKVTPDHRVWKVGYGWIEAQHLQEGDYLSIARKDSPFPGPGNHTKVSQADIDTVLDGGEIPANVYTASAGELSKFLKGVVQPDERGFFEVTGLDKHTLDKLQILFTLFTVKTIIQESAGGYVLMSSGNLTDAAIMLRQWGMRYNYNLLADDCLNDETRLMVKYIGYEELPNEDAYCLEVYGEVKYDPETPDKENDHAWVCNGLVTHNTEIALNTSENESAVCNLGSINLSRHVVDGKPDWDKLKKTVKSAIRMLDNVIDINFYPSKRAERSNKLHRPIGLGVMGYYEYLAKQGVKFASRLHLKKANELFERIAYYAIEASMELAIEKGRYASFEGSTWSKGILTPDTLKEETAYTFTGELDWDSLREKVKTNGMRNSNLLSIAPTATISNIVGTTPCIELPFLPAYSKQNLNGPFKVVEQALRYISLDDIETSFSVDQNWVIEAAAVRQRWICQAQSLNIFIPLETPTGEKPAVYLSKLYIKAHDLGLKSTYYLRSQSDDDAHELLEAMKMLREEQAQATEEQVEDAQEQDETSLEDFDLGKACTVGHSTCESCQ